MKYSISGHLYPSFTTQRKLLTYASPLPGRPINCGCINREKHSTAVHKPAFVIPIYEGRKYFKRMV